eukprot:15434107-Alexandrium_andersonii.AAC.1
MKCKGARSNFLDSNRPQPRSTRACLRTLALTSPAAVWRMAGCLWVLQPRNLATTSGSEPEANGEA